MRAGCGSERAASTPWDKRLEKYCWKQQLRTPDGVGALPGAFFFVYDGLPKPVGADAHGNGHQSTSKDGTRRTRVYTSNTARLYPGASVCTTLSLLQHLQVHELCLPLLQLPPLAVDDPLEQLVHAGLLAAVLLGQGLELIPQGLLLRLSGRRRPSQPLELLLCFSRFLSFRCFRVRTMRKRIKADFEGVGRAGCGVLPRFVGGRCESSWSLVELCSFISGVYNVCTLLCTPHTYAPPLSPRALSAGALSRPPCL